MSLVLAISTAGSVSAESASIEASVRVVPIEIALELSTLQGRVGEVVRAKATVRNAGPTRASNVTVELRLDATALSVKSSLTASIARLQPGHVASISWNICPTRTGNNLVLARASVDGAAVESPTRLLTVTAAAQRKRACS